MNRASGMHRTEPRLPSTEKTPRIDRSRTAIHRVDLSRPVKVAIEQGLLTDSRSLLDYGCGRGADVRLLSQRGFAVTGWDPARGDARPTESADVVNLGYVVNVIERALERVEVLRHAWSLAREVLVVSARLTIEKDPRFGHEYEDGYIGVRGTFQKFYEQVELRDWIEATLGVPAAAAAPGIFYVFRDPAARETFLASRFRRTLGIPRVRVHEQLFRDHQQQFESVLAFLGERGRFPDETELPVFEELARTIGSAKRVQKVVEKVVGTDQFDAVQIARSRDLLVYLALAAFSGRPKLSAMPPAMMRDVKAFFGTYSRACELADQLLFSAGDLHLVSRACAESEIGKLTPTALYVHHTALTELSPLLRVYEGCARVLLGDVEGFTLVKLNRMKPKVSYLEYPSFDKDAHPALRRSVYVHLRSFHVEARDYSASENPFILHRKETFVAPDYPLRSTFEKLTRSEEKHGLLEDTATIGTLNGWASVLDSARVQIAGHRLLRQK